MCYIESKGGDSMGKILSSWSGMRKYLEQEMLADSLKGRIRYGCTTYVGMDGCHIFEICIDGQQIKRFSLETVNTYFIENGFKSEQNVYGIGEYWEDFWKLLNEHPITARSEYTDVEFCDALEIYRNQDISQSIQSENPLIRMFAILDRRIGNRTLTKLKGTMDDQPLWLGHLYTIRFAAEGI
jgi:hypothetical protein